MFFYFLVFIIKSIVLSHDCYSNGSLNTSQIDFIDYAIFCPNRKIQHINLDHFFHLNSISITGNSNVIISCPKIFSKYNITKIIIHDNPILKFDNYCHFNSIEIYGSPIFNYTSTTPYFNHVFLYNESYKFPFFSTNIIYPQIDQLKDEKHQIYCNNLNIQIYDFQSIVNCDIDEFYIEYSDFSNYEIVVNNRDYQYDISFTNQSKFYNDNFTKYFEQIIPSINALGDFQVKYNYFNPEFIAKTGKLFKNNPILWMELNWPKTIFTCHFDGVFSDNYEMESYVNSLIEKTPWNNIFCHGMEILYYETKKETEIIEIPTHISFIIIILAIIIVLFMMFSFLLIAYCRFKIKNKAVKDDSENELSEHSQEI